jgi:hypothetical protein
MKATSTSCPRRGVKTLPQFCPATGVATRTQVPVASLVGALSSPLEWSSQWLPPAPRCQWNWTLMRWSRSVCTGSLKPTTSAVCTPVMVGCVLPVRLGSTASGINRQHMLS